MAIEIKRNKQLGINLKRLREYFHMSQMEVKRQSGVDNATISRCEAGEQPINSDQLEALCRLLNTTPNEILGWEGVVFRQVAPCVDNPDRFKPEKIGEPPKVETPKVETPKVEPPKVEPPKVETPKAKPNESDKEQLHGILCELVHETYVKKNHDYGDSFGSLRKKYPVLICIHIAEKLERLNTLIENPKSARVKESIEDTLMDIANYCLMELTERNSKK